MSTTTNIHTSRDKKENRTDRIVFKAELKEWPRTLRFGYVRTGIGEDWEATMFVDNLGPETLRGLAKDLKCAANRIKSRAQDLEAAERVAQ